MIEELAIVSKDARESSNTLETKPKTIVLGAKDIVEYKRLEMFLNDIVESTFRVKGLIETDKGSFEVSCVGKNIVISPWNEKIETCKIVVISKV